jgi:hypothetical protein
MRNSTLALKPSVTESLVPVKHTEHAREAVVATSNVDVTEIITKIIFLSIPISPPQSNVSTSECQSFELVKINQPVEYRPQAYDEDPIHAASLQADVILPRVFSTPCLLVDDKQPDERAKNMQRMTTDDRIE